MTRRDGDDGRSLDAASDPSARLVAEMRDVARDTARSQGRMLRLVAELAVEAGAEARWRLLDGPHAPGQPPDDEVLATAVAGELQVVLGVSDWSARETLRLAQRLVNVLPDTLDALESGTLDLARVKVIAEATRLMPDDRARSVQALLLPGAGEAPWEGPSPRAWRHRVDRAVVRVDAEAARRRREEAARQRLVRSWPTGDGSAELLVSASAEDVAMAESVITDLAHRWPALDEGGARLTMDQRRVDAVMDLFRRVRDGRGLPSLPVRRQREIGLVLHADTLFPSTAPSPASTSAATGSPASTPAAGGGPVGRRSAGDPGEIRGLGDPVPVDPVSARELADAELARGVALNVLLVDAAGDLQRVVRLPRAPVGGWTRDLLTAAVRDRSGDLAPLTTPGYAPTVAIEDHVRARSPRCGRYDCARSSSRCDLDHDVPWPRGPTTVSNLLPRCRRDHETKTRGLVRSRMRPDGAVTVTTLTGLVVTTRPEPFPGFGAGETYASGRVGVAGGPGPFAA